jgi:AcrR family transcriptional regulator
MSKTTYHHGDLRNALIKAGAELLVEEGAAALSLRKVAAKAGVSHSAPYAHFADKETLIAAISTEGFQRLYEHLTATVEAHQHNPSELLIEVAYAYTQFAQESPAFYKLMFSGVLEHEQAFPDFVSISKANFQLLVDLVERCQAAGTLPEGSAELLAVSVWSLVHGFTSLLLERQIPHTVLEPYPLKELLRRTMRPVLAGE